MSKAFTRESDDEQETPLPVRAPLPPGIKNYITPAGAQRLRDELASLLSAHAVEVRAGQADVRTSRKLARIRQLQEIVGSLVIAEHPAEKEVVRFGATVSVQRQNARETYRLVGVDEGDLDRNEISWLSPLAKVLLGKRAGDRVPLGSPAGSEELTIVSVSYQ